MRVMSLLLVACLLSSCGGDEPASNDQNRTSPAPIDPSVFQPYTRDQFPKAFAAWGVDGIRRVQTLREGAAKSAAANPKCDAVEIAELSDSRSSPPDSPVVFVDCRNGERFYLSESDVGRNLSTEAEKGARFSSAALIERCTNEVRARLNIPASFDPSIWSISDRQGTSGNRVVEFNFKAKNAYGMQLPASARCIMTTAGVFEVTVVE